MSRCFRIGAVLRMRVGRWCGWGGSGLEGADMDLGKIEQKGRVCIFEFAQDRRCACCLLEVGIESFLSLMEGCGDGDSIGLWVGGEGRE